MNKFREWQQRQRLTDTELGELIGMSRQATSRYVLPLDHPDFRIPPREVMIRIVEVTKGEVQPNAFYLLPDSAA